jgi:hypothetical protein
MLNILGHKKKQFKVTLRFHLIPVRMTIIKKTTTRNNNECWRGCRGKGTLIQLCAQCKLVQPLWKAVWRVLKKLKIELLMLDC